MKIKANRKDLLHAVDFVARGIAKRSTMPALNCIKLDATQYSVNIISHRIESWMSHKCPCDGEPGAILVPGLLLQSFLRGAQGDEVTMETDGAKIRASCGKSKVALSTMPIDEFPTLETKKETELSFEEKTLRRTLTKVAHAMCDNPGRPELNCTRIEVENGTATFAATNGHVITLATLPMEGRVHVSIPRDFIAPLIDSLNEKSEDICKVNISDNFIRISVDNWQICSKLSEQRFAPLDRIRAMFKQDGVSIEAPREALINAIKQVRPFTDERFFPIQMAFEDIGVTIQNKNPDHKIECFVELSGKPATIAIDPNYLQNLLGSLDGEMAKLDFKGELQLAIVEDGFQGIIGLYRNT